MQSIIGTALFLTLAATGLFTLFLTAEFMHYQRGHATWAWVARIYHRYNLQRIKW